MASFHQLAFQVPAIIPPPTPNLHPSLLQRPPPQPRLHGHRRHLLAPDDLEVERLLEHAVGDQVAQRALLRRLFLDELVSSTQLVDTVTLEKVNLEGHGWELIIDEADAVGTETEGRIGTPG